MPTCNITIGGRIGETMFTMTGTLKTYTADDDDVDIVVMPTTGPPPPMWEADANVGTPSMPIMPEADANVGTPSDEPTWTPPPMSQKQMLKTVGDKVGLKAEKVKEVTDAMMEVAAEQLKAAGSFTLAGALKLTSKARRKHSRAALKQPATAHVRASPMNKFKEMINRLPLDAD